MFSKAVAPKIFLVIPLVLLITVIYLSFVVIQKMGLPATNLMTPQTNQQTNNDLKNTTNPQTSKSPDSDDVMFKAPTGNYPSSKCPETVVNEGTSRSFAIDAGEKYSLSRENAEWIATNCPNVKTLTF